MIFNVKTAGGVQLWHKKIGAKTEQPLAAMPTLSYADAWVATAGRVYFTTRMQDAVRIRSCNRASGMVEDLMTLPHSPAPLGGLGMSVAPDGKWLVYTRTTDAQADIMLVTN